MLIYTATNKINGMVYVGKTKSSVEKRKSSHLQNAISYSNMYFHRAVRENGIDGFDWEAVFKCDTQEELDAQERYWIRKFRKQGIKLYNILEGQQRTEWSEEQRNIYSEIQHDAIQYCEELSDKIIRQRGKKALKEYKKFVISPSRETLVGREKYRNTTWDENKTRYLGVDTIPLDL
jgi:hypothetical protein